MQMLLGQTVRQLPSIARPSSLLSYRILSTTPNPTPQRPKPLSTNLPQYLGYAGALPFLAGGLLTTLSPESISAPVTQLYGAAILSFLGGVHWGVALRAPVLTKAVRRDFVYSVVPSLVAWGCAAAPPTIGLPALSVSFAVALAYDSVRFRDLGGSGVPGWYRRLRLPLSVAAVAGCAVAARAVRDAQARESGGACLREADTLIVSTSALEGGGLDDVKSKE